MDQSLNPKPLLPADWLSNSLSDLAQLAPIQKVHWPLFAQSGLDVYVKREDLLCPMLGGNKFYKLFNHLKHVSHLGSGTVLSFGGAYSNHIYALAAAGKQLGIRAIGVIRGERPGELSPTLSDAESMGMQLHFISRSEYKQRGDTDFIRALSAQFGGAYVVPEGGSGFKGALGCVSLAQGLHHQNKSDPYDSVWLAAGTGGTLTGLIAGNDIYGDGKTCVHGVLALKGRESEVDAFKKEIEDGRAMLSKELRAKQKAKAMPWYLHTDSHCGGYAKNPEFLQAFMDQFQQTTSIPLEPVYTAKVFWCLSELCKSGYWKRPEKILVIHTGGLQGKRGFIAPKLS